MADGQHDGRPADSMTVSRVCGDEDKFDGRLGRIEGATTVRELIEKLRAFNPDLVVVLNSRHTEFTIVEEAALAPYSTTGRLDLFLFIDPKEKK